MKEPRFKTELRSNGSEAIYEGSRICYRPESTGCPFYVEDLDKDPATRCNFKSIRQACLYLDKQAKRYLFAKSNSYGDVSYYRGYDYPGGGYEDIRISYYDFKRLLNLGWEYRDL